MGQNIRKNIGGLIKQELADPDQILCYYRNIVGENPLIYQCDLGCCPNGCCGAGEIAQATSYGWAIALLIIFIVATVFALVAMLALYLVNRHKDRRQREEMASTVVDSPTGSQINGGGSYYAQEGYYPYITESHKY